MSVEELTSNLPGEEVYVLGNEAVARGAVEAGVWVASCYPGTPSSEVSDTLSELSRFLDFEFEYSANEKVAAEVALGVAIAGGRSMVIFKGAGFFVASDALFHSPYVGISGSMVIVACDEPGLHSSGDEVDMRLMGRAGYFPTFVPANPREAQEMTIEAFKLSEQIKLPVLLRLTTRVCQQRGFIRLGAIPQGEDHTIDWDNKKPWWQQFVLVPATGIQGRLRTIETINRVKEICETSRFTEVTEDVSGIGVLTCGVVHGYAIEALKLLNIKASTFKVGISFPLPDRRLKEFLKGINKLFVVEEVEPYLEVHASALAKDVNPDIQIFGKENGYFPLAFEYNTSVVVKAMTKALGLRPSIEYEKKEAKARELQGLVFPRPPVLCAGCPHRASAYAAKRATKGKAVFVQDVGCYALAAPPPINVGDIDLCMGTSVGVACGLNYVVNKPIVSIIGDSTFFHAGLPGLANAVYNQVNFTLLVLDNGATGMTGFQPNPATGIRGGDKPGKKVVIENVVKGMGVDDLKVLDSYDIKALKDAIKDSVAYEGVSVVISRRKCAILSSKENRERGLRVIPYRVDPDKCDGCWLCITQFGCPPIVKDEDVAKIISDDCSGCGVCAQICPSKAIVIDNQ
ncbi:MAG: thiamine pyrophosphate-dependent enzyme [Thermodesulfobacteriota bacterium]|nr:thiamine pyrophosphate-dependent enzyme [Thermodesulfobacteriota bacterium]